MEDLKYMLSYGDQEIGITGEPKITPNDFNADEIHSQLWQLSKISGVSFDLTYRLYLSTITPQKLCDEFCKALVKNLIDSYPAWTSKKKRRGNKWKGFKK